MTLENLVSGYKDNQENLNWKGSFYDYLKIVEDNPDVVRLSHARIYDMIMERGVEKDEEGNIVKYNFFKNDIFGCTKTINSLVEYFRAGAQGLEPRKRILLMMGPAGGGKSSISTLIKKGLAQYTKTKQGAVYGIVGCPIHEEPLHLLSEELRKQIEKEYGVHIEGELCPYCNWMLENVWGYWKDDGKTWVKDISQVEVKRIVFSEQSRIGIGTFSPASERDQDISELIGSMDLSKIGEIGSESDPRAWKFDGELNIANRGICEFIEILKSNPKFLYLLLNLAQEQCIKTPRYPLMYLDEVIISHTNEAEYIKFMSEKTNEALQDRIHIIKTPYNLSVNDEEKIYDKLLQQGSMKVHLAPNTTKVASMFGILTRLEDVESKKKIGLIDKMKVYNGEKLKNWTNHEIRLLKEESPNEGMNGIGPRYITDALSKYMARPDTACLNPIAALRGLVDHLDYYTKADTKTKEEYKDYIGQVREIYHDMLKKQVMSAFVTGYKEQAKSNIERYLIEINAWRKKDKIKDPVTQEEREPDEKFMRSIEEQIGVSEPSKKEFREEVVAKVADLALENEKFDYMSHDGLKEAIEKKLFDDVKSVVKTVVSNTVLDDDQKKKLDSVIESLKTDGYCDDCAREILKYMSRIID